MSSVAAHGWRSAIVMFAGTPWDGICGSDRQLASELCRSYPVLWVDPPVSVLRSADQGLAGHKTRLDFVAPNLARLTPVTVPGATRPILRRLAAAQRRRAARKAIKALSVRASAVIVATLDDMFTAVPGAVKTFYGTDDYVAGSQLMGMSRRWSERAERRQLANADVVIAVSAPLCDRWASMGAKPLLIPNGADVRLMKDLAAIPLANDVTIPRPIAGFVGHISSRIDIAQLDAVARRGVSVLLIGPVVRTPHLDGLEELLARPNVVSIGARSFTDLPSYYRLMDVGLTPYADSPFNRASFPLKTLEYLSAGLPVVSTDLPAVSYLETDHVLTATDPESFADQVEAAIKEGQDPTLVEARRAVADHHSWERRAERVLAAMGLSDDADALAAGAHR